MCGLSGVEGWVGHIFEGLNKFFLLLGIVERSRVDEGYAKTFERFSMFSPN